jgi:hypothetical protein
MGYDHAHGHSGIEVRDPKVHGFLRMYGPILDKPVPLDRADCQMVGVVLELEFDLLRVSE